MSRATRVPLNTPPLDGARSKKTHGDGSWRLLDRKASRRQYIPPPWAAQRPPRRRVYHHYPRPSRATPVKPAPPTSSFPPHRGSRGGTADWRELSHLHDLALRGELRKGLRRRESTRRGASYSPPLCHPSVARASTYALVSPQHAKQAQEVAMPRESNNLIVPYLREIRPASLFREKK